MPKKTFFKEATKSQIKRKEFKEIKGFLGILDLSPEQYTIIPQLIPRGFESARKFMKHGQEVKLKRFYSLEQVIELNKTPVQLREEAFNNIRRHNYCSYSFQPISKDQRKRKIPLIECLEGARIFAYSHQAGIPIKLKPYADAKRVRIEGAEVVCEVPSRTKREKRIQFKLVSVPFVDSPQKYGIALNLGSDHSCPSKRFSIRYRYLEDKESSRVFNFCAHEIAAYLKLIQQEWDENKNIIPLQMCQFAIPTQETVNYDLRLENNVLIKDEEIKEKDKLRKLNRAEKEIALWALAEGLKHDRTFYSRQSRDGNVQDYNWFLR